MVSRLTGAFLRAVLIVVLLATPSLLLPGTASDSTQIAALVGLFAAALTFFEYSATYPGLIEFRYAPPFNRLRYLSLFLTVFLTAAISRGIADPSALSILVRDIGALLGRAADFPYSPLRLLILSLSDAATSDKVMLLRDAGGLAILVGALTLAIFTIFLKVLDWPSRNGAFNVWVNLPTFDPTVGGDVVTRLERDALINSILGFLAPFLVPAAIRIAAGPLGSMSADAPQSLVWAVAAWSFLPVSLFMRAIALARIAEMIRAMRKQGEEDGLRALQPA